MALGGGPISGEQKIADEVPAVHFAEWIELNQTASVRGRGGVVAGRILVMHHALERLDRAAPQGLTAKEGPLVELRAVAGRKALEKVAPIEPAGRARTRRGRRPARTAENRPAGRSLTTIEPSTDRL